MKTKILLCSAILCLSFLYADNVDFSSWTIKIETKDLPPGITYTQTQVETIAKSMIKNLSFDANQSVQDYLKENGKLARQFERMRLKIKESNIRFLSDGSTIYEYETPITGAILQLLTPTKEKPILLTQLACPTCKRSWPDNIPAPESVKLVPLESELTPQYTAVLIDARDITLNPALFPKIYNEDGKETYSINFATSEYLQARGLITYVNSIADAFNNDLVGINPLRISALKSAGSRKTNIIISNASAKMMHSSQHNLKLLEQCKVVVLISE